MLPAQWNAGFPLHEAGITAESLYLISWHNNKRLDLFRCGLPDLQPELLQTDVPEGRCAAWGQKFLVLGSRCWLVDPQAPTERQIRVMADRVPWGYHSATPAGQRFAGSANMSSKQAFETGFLTGIFHSTHYGLVARTERITDKRVVFYRAVFNDSR